MVKKQKSNNELKKNDIKCFQYAQSEWKIHLVIAINFMSSKDSNETRTMYTKSDNI